jgi:hypothetical protein
MVLFCLLGLSVLLIARPDTGVEEIELFVLNLRKVFN